MREDAHQVPHRVERRLEAPHRVEARGDLEGHADAAHEDELVDPLRGAGHHAERQRTAEAVADERDAVEPEGVEEAEQVVGPDLHPVPDPLGSRGVAEPQDVGRHDPEAASKFWHGEAPVGPGGDAGSRPVDEDDRGTRSHVVVVRRDPTHVDGLRDLGACLGGDGAQRFILLGANVDATGVQP